MHYLTVPVLTGKLQVESELQIVMWFCRLPLIPMLTGGTNFRVAQILSCASTLRSEESSSIGLQDFPLDNLPPLIKIMVNTHLCHGEASLVIVASSPKDCIPLNCLFAHRIMCHPSVRTTSSSGCILTKL